MEKPVIIFGAGNLAEAAIEIFNAQNIVIYGILDDNKELHNTEIHNIPVLGSMDDQGFLKFIGKKCEAFLATDEIALRKSLVKMLNEKRKMMPVNAIHTRAVLSSFAEIHHGIFLNMGSVVGAGAIIGNHCLIHSQATIDHKAILGEHVHIGSGSIIGAECVLEDEVFIGSGCTVVPGIKLGKGCRIGAGSVVIEPVKAGETVFGNPAKKIGK